MKNENKPIYYGILFYFLYIQIYKIISSVLISPVLIMQWNIHLIIVLLLLLVISLAVWFYTIKQFFKIKLWLIFSVIFLSISVSFLNIPDKFYLSGGNSVFYSIDKQSMIANYILICRVVNTIVFLTITYFKYLKIEKEQKLR
jgi:hypothetical protein